MNDAQIPEVVAVALLFRNSSYEYLAFSWLDAVVMDWTTINGR